MKKYLISGLVDKYRIKINLFALSPNSAISVFKEKYPNAEDIYVIQDLFKKQFFSFFIRINIKEFYLCTTNNELKKRGHGDILNMD